VVGSGRVLATAVRSARGLVSGWSPAMGMRVQGWRAPSRPSPPSAFSGPIRISRRRRQLTAPHSACSPCWVVDARIAADLRSDIGLLRRRQRRAEWGHLCPSVSQPGHSHGCDLLFPVMPGRVALPWALSVMAGALGRSARAVRLGPSPLRRFAVSADDGEVLLPVRAAHRLLPRGQLGCGCAARQVASAGVWRRWSRWMA
jgi:hypothetical protein